MHPTIEEIRRWRIGDPVRADVQRRWQQELTALDAELDTLRQQVMAMTTAKRDAEIAPTKRGSR